MRRLARIGIVVCLLLTLWPAAATAQPLPTLTLNGVSGNVTVLAGTLITLVTEPGPDSGIYEYGTADCTGGVAVVHLTTAGVAKGTSISVGFAPFRAGVIGTCRVGTWTAGPTFTLNGVEGDLSVEAGQPITFVADPSVQLYLYASADCSGPTTVNFPSGTVRSEAVATTYSVIAFWPDLSRSICRTATWTAAPPPGPPSLAIDGVAANATPTEGEIVTITSDPGASILVFSTADCSGSSFTILGPFATSMSVSPLSMSYRSFWDAFPDVQSGCLAATWLAAPPTEAPPLTINGVSANATLTVGEIAGFETDPAATISFYLSADCGGVVSSTWSPGFTSNPIEPVTYSARAHWTAFPDIVSECLNAQWVAAPTPSPTPEPSATSSPTETETLTVTETMTPTSDPTAAPTGEPTAVATSDPTPKPSAPATVRPTAAADVSTVPTRPAVVAGVPVVSSLPSTGSGTLVTEATTIGLVALIAIIVAAGAYRATSKR